MKVDSTQKVLELQMMTQIFKNAVGDSSNFQLIMESLTKAMEGGNGDLSSLGLGEQDLNTLGYGGGQRFYSKMGKDIHQSFKEDMNIGNVTIEEAIERAAKKYNVDKDFIRAIIKQESSFDPKSTSGAGAMGLMQLMPGTAEELGVTNPYDIGQNVDGGTRYLKNLLDMYGNSKEMALAAYNAGMGTLKNRDVTSTEGINRLPYETRDYVKKVMQYYGK